MVMLYPLCPRRRKDYDQHKYTTVLHSHLVLSICLGFIICIIAVPVVDASGQDPLLNDIVDESNSGINATRKLSAIEHKECTR
jgi:hypothetical protein